MEKGYTASPNKRKHAKEHYCEHFNMSESQMKIIHE